MDEESSTPDLSKIDLTEWYSAAAAAKRLSENSGKDIQPSYARKLAEYGKIQSVKISERSSLYYKADVDKYIVEDRGEKSGRASSIKKKAKPKKSRKSAENQPSGQAA